ncbi:MAG: FAD-binding protein [Myxococcota bacterium]
MFDLLIIGGGLAGVTAALEARARGARVALAQRSWGATAMSTGALDIAFAPGSPSEPTVTRSVEGHVHAIAASRARHPYAVMGSSNTLVAIADGMKHLVAALEPAGLTPRALEAIQPNQPYVSSLGALVPAATALASHAPVSSGAMACVQLAGDLHFDAKHVAKAAVHDGRATWGRSLTIEPITLRFDGRLPPIGLAQRLDDLGTVHELATELKSAVRGAAAVILPPVLGLTRHRETLATIQDAVGVPVIEALAHLPSVPGVRLQRALDQALRAAGVVLVGEVVAAETSGNRVDAVQGKGGERLPAKAFVLASGRFIAGGVVFDFGCREALFGLPTVTELGALEKDAPQNIVRADPRESHPLMTAGVQVNAAMQPIVEGRVAFANLFAAGMVVGGFASRFALCADGVALATGVLSARGAIA